MFVKEWRVEALSLFISPSSSILEWAKKVARVQKRPGLSHLAVSTWYDAQGRGVGEMAERGSLWGRMADIIEKKQI